MSAPIIDELAFSGRIWQFIHLKYKLESVAKIVETLKKLNASEQEIEEVCSTLYHRVTNDHKKNVLHSLLKADPEKKALFEGLSDWKMKKDDWDKSKI